MAFTKEYVDPILADEKQDTLRRTIPKHLKVGDLLEATCKRRPFAVLRVTSLDLMLRRDIDAERLAQVEKLYPGEEPLWFIGFRVVGKFLPE